MLNPVPSGFALFNLGFRPFFLGASLFSVVTILLWMALYVFNVSLSISELTIYQWHAHEMIFGFSMAVIGGFLLTAVKNWTGVQTIHGTSLVVLFLLWLFARLLFLPGLAYIKLAAIFDLLFAIYLLYAAAIPVIQTRNWRQFAILSKVLLLAIANLFFYLGYTGIVEQGIYWGIYGGLYLVISLILTMGSRVIPFFIERGVGYPVQLSSPKWNTVLGLLLFIIFFISELFLHNEYITGYTAAALFLVYTIRLAGWYTPGIWKKPLLWSLYLAIVFIDIGFLLFAISAFTGMSPFIAIHAFAYGGIGLVTISMMARVSLGHTGRDIHRVPVPVVFAFVLLIMGSIARVAMPLIFLQQYPVWIALSQGLWITAFLLFSVAYAPILVSKRFDGTYG